MIRMMRTLLKSGTSVINFRNDFTKLEEKLLQGHEEMVKEGKNDKIYEAACGYSDWIRNIGDDKLCELLRTDEEFKEWVPNMLRSLFGCWDDEVCKENIKKIADSGGLELRDAKGDNMLHFAALYNSPCNKEVYKYLMTKDAVVNLLFEKDTGGQTPIAMAILHDNKDFLDVYGQQYGKNLLGAVHDDVTASALLNMKECPDIVLEYENAYLGSETQDQTMMGGGGAN